MRLAQSGRCAVLVMLYAVTGVAATPAERLDVARIADGVFVHEGAQAEADDTNQGDIANLAFVIGRDCVAVIDTGGSPAVGQALRRSIEAVTATPVCYVINTHMHPDHVLGNRAFVGADTRFIAAAGFQRALAARGTTYLDRAEDTMGMTADRDWLVMPDQVVEDHTELDLGGRRLELTAWPSAHTNNDLSVFDSASRTLFTGDLLFVDRVPAIDASLTGWLAVMDTLAAKPEEVAHVVPGHGPIGTDLASMLAPQRRYLSAIRDDVSRAIAAGYDLNHALDHTALGERDRWLLFDDYHKRNVTVAYTELEWQ